MNTEASVICELEKTVRPQAASLTFEVAQAESSKQTLVIHCSDAKSMQSLITCAIERNIEQALTSLKILEQEIRDFEAKYGMSSAEFFHRYEEDEIQETLETIDWCFSWRQHEHLHQRLKLLQEASIEI